MKHLWRSKPSRTQRGVSMIEVLIAIFVLAVGMLGTASMQLSSKRANLEAKDRITATNIAQEFIERMRMNPSQLATYTALGVGLEITGSSLTPVDCSAACTDEQIASMDLYDLQQALLGSAEIIAGNNVGGFNSARACIQGANGGSSIYTVAIVWRGLSRLNNPATHDCGDGTGLYDSNDGAQANVHRRVLVLDTFISAPI